MKLLIALAALGVVAAPAAAQDSMHSRDSQTCNSRYANSRSRCGDRSESRTNRSDWRHHQSYRNQRAYRERLAYEAHHRHHRIRHEDQDGNPRGR